jgi:hypothetical protein
MHSRGLGEDLPGCGGGTDIIQILVVALTGILKRRHCEDPITQPNYLIILSNVTIIIEKNAILHREIGGGIDDVVQEGEIERASLSPDAGEHKDALQNPQLDRRTINPPPGHVYQHHQRTIRRRVIT